MITDTPVTFFKVADLHFDLSNPRLAEYFDEVRTEKEALDLLRDATDIQELVQSIAASGFFPFEALVVAKEENKYVVIEGNRRLAAVKALLQPERATNKRDIPVISAEAREALKELPAILSTRKDAWRYLGFKHVNGPAKWTSYAKAAYIAHVHKDFGVSLVEIAKQIGDRHNTVQRLYRGLMVLEQAENAKVYNREDCYRERLAFSHLYTSLDYEGISTFLEIPPKSDETNTPVPENRLKALGELLVWMYGSKKERQPPVIQSQNPDLRELNAVVASREAIAALRAGVGLAEAFEQSKPPAMVFEDALLAAKRELTTVRGHLTTGFVQSESLLKIAGSVANIADDIYTEMDRKFRPEKKVRISE